ncbi:GMC family oxidoreductase [Aeromicrobium sp. UC242_57]|uniref:GMC family oxidoreductase n=1 Tax=Aeromicrobium sp. UC242_57 TaxID=3374624 RepID=UPI00378A71FF
MPRTSTRSPIWAIPVGGRDNILSIYRQMEDHSLGGSATRGQGGPLGVSVPTRTEPVCEAMIGAGEKMGWKRVDDVNASDEERIGYAPSSTRGGTRVSTARAFLRPARGRSNLRVLTDTELTDLVFDGTRVVGVRCTSKGGAKEYRTRGEVILSMGSFESPLTLERAGIGRGDVLRAAGIQLRIESPNVGEKMREHRAVGMQARLKPNLGYNRHIRSKVAQGWTGAKYLASRQGVISQPAYDLAAYFKADESSDRPQLQAFLSPLSVETPGENEVQHSKLIPERESGLNFLTYALRPTSTGSVHVTGPTPDHLPAVDPNYLATQEDRDITRKGFLTMRELLECSPLAELVEFESVPSKSVSTDEQIDRHILLNGSTGYHSLGTCAMGPNDDDVVDADLRVRGVKGLRVVDASVFPSMVSGNCNAPTIAFAWRAADLIKAQAG